MNIPENQCIRHLGFVSESTKNAALGNAVALIMPSPYESLSMVLLEAWRSRIPVLVNSKCEVLYGQTLRSHGGLPYSNYEEFSYGVRLLLNRKDLAQRLGLQGCRYYHENYSWPIIMQKYEKLFGYIAEEQ